jgi:peptide/nickel transport system substrate-binding protein
MNYFTSVAVGAVMALTGIFAVPALASDTGLYGPLAASPVSGGVLNFGLLTEPPSLDPFHQAADTRTRLSVLMYQGLFYEGPTGVAVPMLATGYEVTEDGLEYTISLRQGVKFHDGSDMTAEDVAYSYNYIRDEKNGSPAASDYSVIESLEVVDDSTIKIKLSIPNAALPMTLGNQYGGVVPAGYFDAANAKDLLNTQSVGTGPFKLVEYVPNSHITMEKHAEYWEQGLPYLDGVDFSILPNSTSLMVALQNSRIDLVVLERPQDSEQVAGTEGLVVERWPSLAQKAIDIGLETPPLDDVRVRQAIALAVDKNEIMQASIGDYGTVITTMVAGMQEQWGVPVEELDYQERDLERARALLADAGFADGFSLPLTTISGFDWMGPAAITLREQLLEIGIDTQINPVDLGVWIDNFRNYKMGFTFNDWATQPDPSLLFYRHFHSRPDGADYRNWNNEEASNLLDIGRESTDDQVRKQAYSDYQKIMSETVPTIMLFSADHVSVRSDDVQNFAHHPSGWYFGLARTYLDRD